MGDVVGLDGKPVSPPAEAATAATEPAPAPVAPEAEPAAPATEAPAGDAAGFDWRTHYAGMTDGELQREFERVGGELGAEVGRGIEMWLDFFAEPDRPGESLFKRVGRFFGGK